MQKSEGLGRKGTERDFVVTCGTKAISMDIPDKHKKHIQIQKELFDEHGNHAMSAETKFLFDKELSKKVTDAVNLLEELGLYHDPSVSQKALTREGKRNDLLNDKLRTIEIMSFLSVLWCIGSFYSFIVEKNRNVGLLFLSLVTVSLLYLIYTINKKNSNGKTGE